MDTRGPFKQNFCNIDGRSDERFILTSHTLHASINFLLYFCFFFFLFIISDYSVATVIANAANNEQVVSLDSKSSKPVIDLTPSEKAWLVDHGPTVRVSLFNLPPLQFEQDDKMTGYQVDVLEAVLDKVGLQPIYTLDPLAKVLDDLKEKKTEIGLDFIPTEEREQIVFFSKKSLIFTWGFLLEKSEQI